MSPNTLFILLTIGLGAGVLSGLVGIGGGVVMIPCLVLILGMSQHMAQGTTLAVMIPPIGLLAALTYFQQGMVDFKAAGLICAGFIIGGFLGAKLAVMLPDWALRRVFAVFIILIGLRMLVGK